MQAGGNQKRESWRAHKGNGNQEEERWRSGMEGWAERKKRKERKLRRGAGAFTEQSSSGEKSKIKRQKGMNDTRLWRRLLVSLMLKHKCFSNVGTLTCRKRSGFIKSFVITGHERTREAEVISLEGNLETDD